MGYSTLLSNFTMLLNILKFISTSTRQQDCCEVITSKWIDFKCIQKSTYYAGLIYYTTAFILSADVFFLMNGASESKMETEWTYTGCYRGYDWHNKPYNDYIVTTHHTPHTHHAHDAWLLAPILGSGKASRVSCCPCILQWQYLLFYAVNCELPDQRLDKTTEDWQRTPTSIITTEPGILCAEEGCQLQFSNKWKLRFARTILQYQTSP